MATTIGDVASGPPFPLPRQTSSPWREQALARIGEQRVLLCWMTDGPDAVVVPASVRATIEDHWTAAAAACVDRTRRGATVERAASHLDAVDVALLRVGPPSYVYGQLPGLAAQIRKVLPEEDLRRMRIEELAERDPSAVLTPGDRDLIVAAREATSTESRLEVTRVRSFRNILLAAALVLTLGAVGLGIFTFADPSRLPLCFAPDGDVVCTTSTTSIDGGSDAPAGQPSRLSAATIDAKMRDVASSWDVPLVELVGLLAAAVAGAASMRRISGSSTPFALPIAAAVLKLPTGALTAVLGLLLMRGGFVPGLSALDSSGQIVAWAVILGYSQQLLTRFVDQRAQTVLEDVGRTKEEKQRVHGAADPAPGPL
ncbi:MAG: hypothetical protein HZB46_17400 [Solirubrobacterales bacterium]|nr:hypothetical protein [Solirubrobacterales bacterium]